MKKVLSVLNPKNWLKFIVGRVIFRKVWGKFVKHVAGFASGVVVSFLFSDNVLAVIQPVLDQLSKDGVQVTPESVHLFVAAIVAGLFGSLWNYINHRFLKR